MRPLTLLRAATFFGAVVAGWSLNLLWGTDSATGKGPPVQWERPVVGAALLCAVALVALSISGRKGAPPAWVARGLAVAAGAGALAIAFSLRRSGAASGFDHLLQGQGWAWLTAGAAVTLAASAATLFLRGPRLRKRNRGRRR